MSSTFGLYFKGLPQEDANAMRKRLNVIAASYGYLADSGPTKDKGNVAEMLVAIDEGELAVVFLPDEQRSAVVAWIERESVSIENFVVVKALEDIARQLRAAMKREKEAEEKVNADAPC